MSWSLQVLQSNTPLNEGETTMLTGDLIRVRVTRTNIRPQLVSPTSPKHTERAEQLLHLFEKALEQKQSRKEIQDWVAELSSLDVEHKIFKGLAKVLLDRAEFTEPILPVEKPPSAVQIRAQRQQDLLHLLLRHQHQHLLLHPLAILSGEMRIIMAVIFAWT